MGVESPAMGNPILEVDREFLMRTPIFAGLPGRVIDLIASSMRLVQASAGEELLREGDPARSMFVVHHGEIEIFKRGKDSVEQTLAILTQGDCLGEMSLIDIQPRSATARARGTAVLYVLELAEIAKLYGSDVEAYALLVLNISREISRRLRCADELIASMGITASALWSDAADATARPSRLLASEPS
ncbi:MAG TPA: cyclic nucleotide-binding domain-containing protein [Polyangiaceae bacterium]|nr:cyclic nucleotide-binding domain-containing protein [Polyangiaceae bacterium]